ncbi:hypothetical protein CPA56_08305 [Bombella sp. TMW2.1889]|uniref:Uncharacterized protein n=1 Tax=Bombella mellum TaxID=2039288 RepID=A0ABR5ZUI8_9PROT|nr:hypothetical protein [Bombella mellum]
MLGLFWVSFYFMRRQKKPSCFLDGHMMGLAEWSVAGAWLPPGQGLSPAEWSCPRPSALRQGDG